MAAISVAEYIRRIVVGPVAGVWIDGLRRKPVLIATNVVRGLLFLALAMAATMIGRDNITAYRLPHDRHVAVLRDYSAR